MAMNEPKMHVSEGKEFIVRSKSPVAMGTAGQKKGSLRSPKKIHLPKNRNGLVLPV